MNFDLKKLKCFGFKLFSPLLFILIQRDGAQVINQLFDLINLTYSGKERVSFYSQRRVSFFRARHHWKEKVLINVFCAVITAGLQHHQQGKTEEEEKYCSLRR